MDEIRSLIKGRLATECSTLSSRCRWTGLAAEVSSEQCVVGVGGGDCRS